MDWLEVGFPSLQLLLGIGENLPSLVGLSEGVADITRYDGGVVEQ